MKKLLLILVMFIDSNPVFSESFILRTPKIELLEIQEKMNRENLELVKKSVVDSLEDINPCWVHKIDSVQQNGIQLTLADQTVWSIGWWWQSKVEDWKPNDEILLTFDFTSTFNFIEFFNVTQNQIAWGNLFDIPRKINPNIKSISDLNDYFYTVTLNNGLCLIVDAQDEFMPPFRNWRVGDAVIAISIQNSKNPYALWNIIREEIVGDIKIISE